MSVLSRVPVPIRVLLVLAGYALLWVGRDGLETWQLQGTVVALGYAFLLWTSGALLNWVLEWAGTEKDGDAGEGGDGAGSESETDVANPAADGGETRPPESDAADVSVDDAASDPLRIDDARTEDGRVTQQDRDVGVIVGKSENVLLLTFILAEAYTALAVIFAAKGLVRREDIEKNTLYYLAGTLTNVTYSVAVGVAVRVTLVAFGVGGIAFLKTP